MRLAAFVLLAMPIVFAALSGCASCVDGPPVSARGIVNGDAEAGRGGFLLDILVTDGPGGAPLAGAGVVVYWSKQTTGEWSSPRVDVDGDRVVVEPMNASSTVAATSTQRMLTGPDGHARAHVDPNRILGVVAAKDGFTEEWFPAVAGGDSGATGRLRVPLYRARIVEEMDAVWGPGGASTGTVTNSDYLWDPAPAPFGETEEDRRGYAARLIELTVSVTWSNGATSGGDLAVGVGAPGDEPALFEDRSDNVAAGAQNETATFTLPQLAERGVTGAPAVNVGAASDSGYYGPFGLPYKIRVDALFDTAKAAFGRCATFVSDGGGPGAKVPGPGVALLVAAGVVAALLASSSSRRRQRSSPSSQACRR